MNLEAIYHRPKLNWSYAYDKETIHLRVRTKRNDIDKVTVMYGDKHAWEKTISFKEMSRFAADSLYDYWEASVCPPYRRLRYAFQFHAGNKTCWMTENGFEKEPPYRSLNLFDFPFLNGIDVFETPAWVKESIFYQIIPERFATGDVENIPDGAEPFCNSPKSNHCVGGDLQGVIDHLDYLVDLGINAIYFTPIFEASSNHKYDTQDDSKVDPPFGTNELVKKLVKECHLRGIRVLLDAGFNHCGDTFPPFLDEPILPKLNTENPEIQEYLLKAAVYWIEEIGIDGWRLDAANEADHHFWRKFRKAVSRLNPEAYILREIWHDSLIWLQGDQFDGVMNNPFTGAVSEFFLHSKLDAAGFANSIGRLLARYPQQVNEVVFNFLGSQHAPRILTLAGGNVEKMKLAILFQFTFLGTPCIYYGDEIGLTGERNPDCRNCMEWDASKQDTDLLEFYKKLIRLRKEHPALRTGKFSFIHARKGDSLLAYERRNDSERFVVILNPSKKPQTISIPLKHDNWEWKNVCSGECYNHPNNQLTLSKYGYIVLKYFSKN